MFTHTYAGKLQWGLSRDNPIGFWMGGSLFTVSMRAGKRALGVGDGGLGLPLRRRRDFGRLGLGEAGGDMWVRMEWGRYRV